MKEQPLLRICFIVPFLFRLQRGIERSSVDLSNALVDLGHQVTLLTWESRGKRTHFNIDPRIRIAAVPYVRYFQARWAVPFYVWELLRHRYDMVNIYFAGYGEAQALPLARRFRQFPLFFTAGFPIEQVPHRFMEFKKTALAQELDSIVVKSASMEESIAKFFGRKVTVIPNGVDASFFKAGNASVARLPNGFHEESANVILTVAALEERKGVQHVVAAIPALLAAHPTLRYLVVGDGPYRATLQAQVRGLGLERHVHFVGAVTDVRPYYAHADLFCLLSRGEGLPNALLEAWAMGLPVVVAQQPPFDAIVPSECGLTVRESDLTDVVKAIESLLGDEGRRKRMGDAGRRHVLAEYTWATVARRYLSMFGADSAT